MSAEGPDARAPLFFEDFVPGQAFELGSRWFSEPEIVALAQAWDPQPLHLDARAAAEGPFGGLIASGWHTACVWMRMYVDAVLSRASMLVAQGIEEPRCARPLEPGIAL